METTDRKKIKKETEYERSIMIYELQDLSRSEIHRTGSNVKILGKPIPT